MFSFFQKFYDKYIKGDEEDESWIISRKNTFVFSLLVGLVFATINLKAIDFNLMKFLGIFIVVFIIFFIGIIVSYVKIKELLNKE